MSNNIMDIMASINDEIPAHVQDDVISLLDNYCASLFKPPTTIKDILNYLLENDSAADLDVPEHTNNDLNALGNNYEDNLNVSDMVARSQQSQQIQLIGPMMQIEDDKPAKTEQTTTLTTDKDNFFVDPDDGTIVYLPADLVELETVAQTPQTYSKSEKENQEDYECMICRRTFRRHYNFRQHMKLHDPISYECEVCHHVFDSRHYYDLHMKSHTPPYVCEVCGRRFMNKLHLTYHSKSHLGGKEPYKCNVCNRAFQYKYLLDQHSLVHLDLPYRCDVCIRSFKYKYLLDRHIASHSDNKKPCKDPLKKKKILSSNMETP
ncbi:zinc finger protein 25-like [Bradysia coprophila]|uniref:zinc finger protein 25-like n=1 Tax=Bradysia coprophila TaxID=38358 RepID=UPI00187DA738|nr:zinc finger protein 25-like [Bradysia coprophila]